MNKKHTFAKVEVQNLFKMSEENNFKEGCNPDTTQISNVDISFSEHTLHGLLDKICEQLGIENDPENYELNAGDEDGRIDFQVMENADGIKADKQDLDAWMDGNKRLWACTYTAQVKFVKRETLKLLG